MYDPQITYTVNVEPETLWYRVAAQSPRSQWIKTTHAPWSQPVRKGGETCQLSPWLGHRLTVLVSRLIARDFGS